jgi:hypothetical protein
VLREAGRLAAKFQSSARRYGLPERRKRALADLAGLPVRQL